MVYFDAAELDRWSDLPDAPHRLPELIRRLVAATRPMARFDIPSGSSVRLPGWDGLVDVEEGNAWIPSGVSAWEFSCEQRSTLTGKATADYKKRTKCPLGVDKSKTTFVFATSRRWPGRRKWVRERREDGDWFDVQALDADGLVAWLEQAPEVADWFAQLIGKLPAGTEHIHTVLHRRESLHSETRSDIIRHIDTRFDELRAERSSWPAQAMALTEPASQEAFPNPAHGKLAEKIDFARDLINRGRVDVAREELESLRAEAEAIPAELRFRIVTNQAACALADEDIDRARALLEEAHELQPDNPKAIANAAVAAQLGKDSQRALELAHQARALEARHPQATSVLIEVLWQTAQSEALEDLVATESWITQDQQCALILASIRTQQSRFEEAATLCRSRIQDDPEDASAHLALGECLLNHAQADRHTDGYTDEVIGRLREAKREATQAVDLLRTTELRARRHRALVVRACARGFLGATDEAMRDFDAVLGEAPHHPDAAFNKGLFLLYDGCSTEARAVFEGIRDPERKADAVLPLADVCLATGDAPAVVRLLKGTLKLDRPSWEDIHRAKVLLQAESMVGDDDSVTPILDAALGRHPDDPRLLTLSAACRSQLDDPEGAENLLVRALEHAGRSDRLMILLHLGAHYQNCRRFSEAADRFAEVVNGVASQPAAIPLLICLRNSQRLREALGWARAIQKTHRQSPRLTLEVETEILEHVGDVRTAVSRYQELCSRPDATLVHRVMLAAAQFRCGERAAARVTVRRINTAELRDEPQVVLKLALLKLLLDMEGCLEDAYLARRYRTDDPAAHLGYMGLFLVHEGECVKPDHVGPGCAVLLKNDEAQQWWHILDDGEESRDRHELTPSNDLAQRLLGQRVGDTIVLREGIEELTYEVSEVQSKFVRAFQETGEEFSTRFPDNVNLSRIRVDGNDFSSIFQVVDRRGRLFRQAERLYDEGLPFASFCSLVGTSTVEGWHVWTRDPSKRLRFGAGTPEEASQARTLLQGADGVVLDMPALLTVHELKLAEQLRRRFSRVAVPQQVIDELQEAVLTTKLNGPIAGYLGRGSDGRYTLIEVSSNDLARWQNYVCSLLQFAESFERIAAHPLLDTDDVEKLMDVLTPAGAGAVYAGDEQSTTRLVLVSDDLGLSNLARFLGTDSVNTQAVLRELRCSNGLTDEEYSTLIERLVLLNYQFVQVRSEDIVQRLEANGYMTTDGTRAMLKTLEGPDCSDESAVSVGAEVVTALAGRPPSRQLQLLLSAVVATLWQGRERRPVLLKFRKALADALTLAPYARDQLLRTVDLYLWI